MTPASLYRWLAAYAEATSTDAKFTNIAKHAKEQDGDVASKTSITFYRQALEDLGAIDPLPAWTSPRAPLSDTKTSAGHHLVDPSLAAHLMGLITPSRLVGDTRRGIEQNSAGRTIFGALFQSLVTQSVRVYADALRAKTFWLGITNKGRGTPHEVDLIVQSRDQKVVAIQIKLSDEVDDDDVRHLRWLRGELRWRWADGIVVNTGSEAYRRGDGIGVVPAGLLGP